MPDSPETLPTDLIAEVGRFNAIVGVLRIMAEYPLRKWPAGIALAARVLFA